MIVYWNKYQKTQSESDIIKHTHTKNKLIVLNAYSKQRSTEDKSTNLNNHLLIEDVIIDQPLTSSTTPLSSNVNAFQIDFEKNELCMSILSSSSSSSLSLSIDNEDNYDDISLNKDVFINELEFLLNSDSIDISNHNFPKAISSQDLFDSLMEAFYANPHLFIQYYYEQIVQYSIEIVTSPISHLLLIEILAYYSYEQMTTFLTKTIVKYYNFIIKNQYGIKVLTQYVKCCIALNDESMLLQVMKLITSMNFINTITDEKSLRMIYSLLNVNNHLVCNSIIEAIGRNALSIALSYNGVKIIRTFVNCPDIGRLIVNQLLGNINVILVHHNGFKVIELLLELKVSAVTLSVIISLLSNISFISNTKFYLELIEKSLMSLRLDSNSAALLQNELKDPILFDFLIKSQIGIRIVNSTNRLQNNHYIKIKE